MAEPFW